MYRQYLESLCKNVTSCITLLRWVAGSSWGAGGKMLRTAPLTLVHFTAKYYAPVWCHSCHASLIYPAINEAFQILTQCLHPTPAGNLPILAGIQPAELHCKWATLSLALQCHGVWTSAPLSDPLSIKWDGMASQIETPFCTRIVAHWADDWWNAE